MYCLIDGWSGVIMTGESPMQFATEVEAESWAKRFGQAMFTARRDGPDRKPRERRIACGLTQQPDSNLQIAPGKPCG